MAEAVWFESSNYKTLPKEKLGVDALRRRLSVLLFEHVKNELPKLREDLETALRLAQRKLSQLGNRRSTSAECREYLMWLSTDYSEICRAALSGHYEGEYFQSDIDDSFSFKNASTLRRTRAVVQSLNKDFSNDLRTKGYKYHILPESQSNATKATKTTITSRRRRKWRLEESEEHTDDDDDDDEQEEVEEAGMHVKEEDVSLHCNDTPEQYTRIQALEWVRRVLCRTRGQELIGNFNPLLIGELFWEQSSKWRAFASSHIERVSQICSGFLQKLLKDKCPTDLQSRLWTSIIEDAVEAREKAAFQELDLLMEDLKHYPINYNHYYSDTINRCRVERREKIDAASDKSGTAPTTTAKGERDMENFSCEDALDCLFAIYKVRPSYSYFEPIYDQN
jgi:hypothetical protein